MPESHVAWRLARIAAHRCAGCDGGVPPRPCTLLADVQSVVKAALAATPDDRTLARFAAERLVPGIEGEA